MNTIDWSSVPLEWKEFTIPKKHKKGVRHISAPCDELKEAQHRILAWFYSQDCDMLKPTWFAVATRNRGLMSGVSRHGANPTLILEMDIQDFFDSMPVDHVKSCLVKAGVGATLVDNIIRCCSHKGRFPQGGPASPYLMEIGMREVDMELSSFAKKMGMVYTRYVDDLTLSFVPGGRADEMLKRFREEHPDAGAEDVRARFAFVFRFVKKLLGEIGLSLNTKKNRAVLRKSRCQSPRINGVVLRQDEGGFNAPRRSRDRARAALHSLAQRVRNGEPVKALRSQWARVKGFATWFDMVRGHSPDPACATADPRLNEDDWNVCKEAFQ